MLLETYYVPSESMLPTLLIGDHMLVDKLSFGPRVPLTEIRVPARRDPKRGDVVIFHLGRSGPAQFCPVDRCPDRPRENFVKRVIGIPGDTIEVRAGRVIANGEPLRVTRQDGEFVDTTGTSSEIGREDIAGTVHLILDRPASNGLEQVHITVPDERYFLMGDNRDNSVDSRSWGTVHRDDIVGHVTRIYWSWNNRESWAAMLNPLTWWRLLSGETRWDRLGSVVE
jgi:signal peptidase I